MIINGFSPDPKHEDLCSPECSKSPLSPPAVYADGLEVVPPSYPPEWLAGGAEEIPGREKEAANGLYHHHQHRRPASRPWWRSKRFLLGMVVLIAVTVGVGAGLGIGLSNITDDEQAEQTPTGGPMEGSSNDPEDDTEEPSDDTEEEPTGPPNCKDTVCPPILPMVTYDSALYIFARTCQDTIVYRRLAATESSDSPDSASWDDWEDLGDPRGRLISQPVAASWTVDNQFPRLDVLAISTDNRTVWDRWHSEVEGWSTPDGFPWRGLGPQMGSRVALCTAFPDRLDFWATDEMTGYVTKTEWFQYSDDDRSEEGSEGDTNQNGLVIADGNSWFPVAIDGDSRSRSAVAVVCRESVVYHDIFWYGLEDNRLYHAYYEGVGVDSTASGTWRMVPQPWEGDWIGDPTAYSSKRDPERWDLFGIQADHKLYHVSWRNSFNSQKGDPMGDYSNLTNLGGSIASAPAVISLDPGVLDIVALSTEGRLQHRHHNGSAWSEEWEDLGVTAHSAPSITIWNDKVYLAAVAANKTLVVWWRECTVGYDWKSSLTGMQLEGDLSRDFFTKDM